MTPIAKIQSVLTKPFMPAVFFLSGVTYDTLTLTRIDRLQDNLLLMIYLLLLGVLIVLTGRLGIEPAPDREQLAARSPFARWVLHVRPYYPMATQFLLGGLFSAYAIFYSRSARSPVPRSFLRYWSFCWSATNFCTIGSLVCVSL
jgi:hypothetical protein